MAFIRDYAARSAMGRAYEMGDPFSLRIPRKLRKLKVGRALGKVAKAAVGFIPGVGSVLSPVLSGLVSKLQHTFPQLPEDVLVEAASGFARDYGIDIGDPGTPVSKRKKAATGTKAKAAVKADNRTAKQTGKKQPGRGKGPVARKGNASKPSLGGAAAALGTGLSHLEAFGVTGDDIASILGGGKSFLHGKGGGGAAGGFGGHHRRQNPANVKALNRSLRRVEGFEKLASRVFKHKLYRRVRGAHAHPCPPAHRGKKR